MKQNKIEVTDPVDVGTVAGRHELPVTEYILIEDVSPGQEAYEKARLAARAWARARMDSLFHLWCQTDGRPVVRLYYTGLTEITLGVIDGFEDAGLTTQRDTPLVLVDVPGNYDAMVAIMRYETPTGRYVRLVR